jgi:hypothetical protein
LEAFAASKPDQATIEEIARCLATDYVAGGDVDIWEARRKPAATRDYQHENIQIMHQYFMLYEELSHSMNFGDIGRVETCFPEWVYILKATGKHKYATAMVKQLTDIHFVYPNGLK